MQNFCTVCTEVLLKISYLDHSSAACGLKRQKLMSVNVLIHGYAKLRSKLVRCGCIHAVVQ